jgi:hypothetical protein
VSDGDQFDRLSFEELETAALDRDVGLEPGVDYTASELRVLLRENRDARAGDGDDFFGLKTHRVPGRGENRPRGAKASTPDPGFTSPLRPEGDALRDRLQALVAGPMAGATTRELARCLWVSVDEAHYELCRARDAGLLSRDTDSRWHVVGALKGVGA